MNHVINVVTDAAGRGRGAPVTAIATAATAATPPAALTAPELAHAYCGLMSGFPTGVAVVTSAAADGEPFGLTCSSLTSVTLAPPTLLVCIGLHSRTLAAIRGLGAFGVNLLHARGRRAAEVFASPGPDRFGAVAWEPHGRDGVPRLTDDTLGFACCDLAELRTVGDHALVVGRVAEVLYTPDTPLLYGLRRFAAWQPDNLEEPTCVS
ncbi:flavin reductase family protein [Actinocrinis puniceicyclus]|uniref:Flavin reductase family protein n=1 Tax=Actinocrinis puniceicyclus TaxID=977794 RepID=A0A8J7WU07_9ACTN|nr:flavin reductase family protein [Actinocrinis puniceicyclus]MBS2965972.1 flavin reductase family protein [Actinocrinis puniceicyclus]